MMKMKRNNIIAYAMAFSSYLLQSIKSESSIINIILFGSVARNDFDKDSDIDIFVDTTEDIEKEVNSILDSFYESAAYTRYWKLLAIENEISIKVGEIEKWDVKRSIVSHGITLYGKYNSDIEGKLYSLFTIDIKGKRNEKLKIWRKLYGYKQKIKSKDYLQKGLLEEIQGRKVGPAVFIVPIENAGKAKEFLNRNKVKYKIIEMQTDSI
jgi:predicted nucleotidyltransferase